MEFSTSSTDTLWWYLAFLADWMSLTAFRAINPWASRFHIISRGLVDELGS